MTSFAAARQNRLRHLDLFCPANLIRQTPSPLMQ
jgi:hypothetical protein